jgi:hypothetical protein
MATYSFQDVTASLTGTGGVINLGAGSANSKEGITITLNQPRNAMTGGADGEYMHSLRADKTGTITIRLLNTSPVNSQLQTLYAAQSLSSSAWGNNLIVVQNRGNNEVTTARGCAFQRQPDRTYAEDGGFVEWVFDCGKIDTVTGTYSTGE